MDSFFVFNGILIICFQHPRCVIFTGANKLAMQSLNKTINSKTCLSNDFTSSCHCRELTCCTETSRPYLPMAPQCSGWKEPWTQTRVMFETPARDDTLLTDHSECTLGPRQSNKSSPAAEASLREIYGGIPSCKDEHSYTRSLHTISQM